MKINNKAVYASCDTDSNWYLRGSWGLQGPLPFSDFMSELLQAPQRKSLIVYRAGWSNWQHLTEQLYIKLSQCWQLHTFIFEWPEYKQLPPLPRLSFGVILTDGGQVCLGQLSSLNQGLVVVEGCDVEFSKGPITFIVRDRCHEHAFRGKATVVRTFPLEGTYEVWLRIEKEDHWFWWLQDVSEKLQLNLVE